MKELGFNVELPLSVGLLLPCNVTVGQGGRGGRGMMGDASHAADMPLFHLARGATSCRHFRIDIA